jgi:hypothetical protein
LAWADWLRGRTGGWGSDAKQEQAMTTFLALYFLLAVVALWKVERKS